jgi:hypothetical protein
MSYSLIRTFIFRFSRSSTTNMGSWASVSFAYAADIDVHPGDGAGDGALDIDLICYIQGIQRYFVAFITASLLKIVPLLKWLLPHTVFQRLIIEFGSPSAFAAFW